MKGGVGFGVRTESIHVLSGPTMPFIHAWLVKCALLFPNRGGHVVICVYVPFPEFVRVHHLLSHDMKAFIQMQAIRWRTMWWCWTQLAIYSCPSWVGLILPNFSKYFKVVSGFFNVFRKFWTSAVRLVVLEDLSLNRLRSATAVSHHQALSCTSDVLDTSVTTA